MSTLERVKAEFDLRREQGYNKYDAADRAVEKVFDGVAIKPHIHKDNYEDASHVFYGNQVLFFDGSIYTSEPKNKTLNQKGLARTV